MFDSEKKNHFSRFTLDSEKKICFWVYACALDQRWRDQMCENVQWKKTKTIFNKMNIG